MVRRSEYRSDGKAQTYSNLEQRVPDGGCYATCILLAASPAYCLDANRIPRRLGSRSRETRPAGGTLPSIWQRIPSMASKQPRWQAGRLEAQCLGANYIRQSETRRREARRAVVVRRPTHRYGGGSHRWRPIPFEAIPRSRLNRRLEKSKKQEFWGPSFFRPEWAASHLEAQSLDANRIP